MRLQRWVVVFVFFVGSMNAHSDVSNSPSFQYKHFKITITVKDAGVPLEKIKFSMDIEDQKGNKFCKKEDLWSLSDFSSEETNGNMKHLIADGCPDVPLKMKLYSVYRNETTKYTNDKTIRTDRDYFDTFLSFTETETEMNKVVWERLISMQTTKTNLIYFDGKPQ